MLCSSRSTYSPTYQASVTLLLPMASASNLLSFFFVQLLLLLPLPSLSYAKQSFRPRALLLSVAKDAATLQYVTRLSQRTPLVPLKLVVDLGGRFLWVDCDSGYVSSSYLPARCKSRQCSLAQSFTCGDCYSGPAPGCNNNTYGLFPDNPVTSVGTSGEAAQDILSLPSTDGSNPGPVVRAPRFLFSCGRGLLLEGLASGAKGMASLGRTKIALPSQLAAAFRLPRKFAICLSPAPSNGIIFFGDGPYVLLPGIDLSKSLIYTPLLTNPVSGAGVTTAGETSSEYFIGVKSIKINEKRVAFNTSLLSINKKDGTGGTKISTVNPYTILHSSIYKPFTAHFVRAAKSMNITQVAAVAPFGTCFSSKGMIPTRLGPAVPAIDLVLHKESVFWRIFGANSMVLVNRVVWCLAFVDGGAEARTSIVIGGHHLENTFLQFDLAASRVGFTTTLLKRTTCGNFNFTSNAD